MEKNYLFMVKDLTVENNRGSSSWYSKEELESSDAKDLIPARKGTFKFREADGTLEFVLKVF